MNQTFLILDNSLLMLYNIAVIVLLINMNWKSYKDKALPFHLILLSIFIASIYVIYFHGFEVFTPIMPVLVQVPLLFAFSLVSRHRGAKLCFVILTSLIWCMPLLLLGNLVMMFFDYNQIVKIATHILCIPMLLYLIKRFFSPLYSYMLEHFEHGWTLFCFIPLLCLLVSYIGSYFFLHFDVQTLHQIQIWRHIIISLTFAIYLLLIFSFKQIKEQLEIQNKLELVHTQLYGATDYIQNLKQSLEQTAMHQHDLRHHLQFIHTMATSRDDQAIIDYIHTLQDTIDASEPQVFCKNETVNMILTAFHGKAKKDQVALMVKGHLPDTLHIPDADLCVLLSNALENAIKATKLVQNSPREIKLSLHTKNEQIFIEITNPYDQEIVLEAGLPKSDRETGGIGTKSIAYIVEKYAGLYNFDASQGIFVLQIVI